MFWPFLRLTLHVPLHYRHGVFEWQPKACNPLPLATSIRLFELQPKARTSLFTVTFNIHLRSVRFLRLTPHIAILFTTITEYLNRQPKARHDPPTLMFDSRVLPLYWNNLDTII